MLGPDYLELQGVLTPTEFNAPSRARLERREGIERTGLRALDAEAAAELSELIGLSSVVEPDGSHRVQTAPDRAAIVYLDRATARRRYPGEWLGTFKEEGGWRSRRGRRHQSSGAGNRWRRFGHGELHHRAAYVPVVSS